MLIAQTHKPKKIQLLEGLSFTPLIDGSFTMETDDDAPVHIPRHIAIAPDHYPSLTAAHDVIFGKDKWGPALPLTVPTAPFTSIDSGSTAIAAHALRGRSFAELLDFFIVLVELEVTIKGEVPEGQTEQDAVLLRREGQEWCMEMLAPMADQVQAMSWCVADELQKVRKLLVDAVETDAVRELCTKSSLPR